jgi:LysR family hca operon transcriptional activator
MGISMSSITVTQLKYFKAVVESGGFSRAAERINVSQPALTRHIQALEDECHVPLLRRTARGVILTEEGKSILDAAQKIFDSLEYTQNLASSFARKSLRIRSVSTPKLAEFMRLCREQLTNIEIDVAIATYSEILDALSRRDCDVGFLTMPDDEDGFDAMEIGRFPFHAYVPVGHPWALRKEISITELSGEKIIISPRIRRSRQVFDNFLAQYGVEVAVAQEVGSVETIWHLSRENIGVGILSYNGPISVGNLVQLSFQEPITIPLHMVALPKDKRPKLVNLALALGQRQLCN